MESYSINMKIKVKKDEKKTWPHTNRLISFSVHSTKIEKHFNSSLITLGKKWKAKQQQQQKRTIAHRERVWFAFENIHQLKI